MDVLLMLRGSDGSFAVQSLPFSHDTFRIVDLPSFLVGVILDSEVRGENGSTKLTVVVGKVGLAIRNCQKGFCHRNVSRRTLTKHTALRYFNQFQRGESVHQYRIATCFHQ